MRSNYFKNSIQKREMMCVKSIKNISSDYNYFVSETLETFIKQNFVRLFDGDTFIVYFEGSPKELFMTRDLQICVRNFKED